MRGFKKFQIWSSPGVGCFEIWNLVNTKVAEFYEYQPYGGQIIHYIWKTLKQTNKVVLLILNYWSLVSSWISTLTLFLYIKTEKKLAMVSWCHRCIYLKIFRTSQFKFAIFELYYSKVLLTQEKSLFYPLTGVSICKQGTLPFFHGSLNQEFR